MKKVNAETLWFITGQWGLYVGGRFRRKDAIEDHCTSLRKTWRQCRKDGDRAIKCTVQPNKGNK